MKRWLSTLTAMTALLGLTTSLSALANERLVDVQVRDMDRSNTLQRYYDRNQVYVAGRPGNRYAVVMQNLTSERVLAVLSVDGVNAISGETASASQTGYVLAPYQRMEVRGWRKSMQDVAQFRFTDLPDSYAARTGRPDNVGVIGVAAFRERGYNRYDEYSQDDNEYRRYRSAPKSSSGSVEESASDAAAPSVQSERSVQKSHQELGTAHGERRYDPARRTNFERESSYPNQVANVFYDSYEALVDRGIIRERIRQPRGRPDAFPIGFVPDPYSY
jgi:hypothetical protein